MMWPVIQVMTSLVITRSLIGSRFPTSELVFLIHEPARTLSRPLDTPTAIHIAPFARTAPQANLATPLNGMRTTGTILFGTRIVPSPSQSPTQLRTLLTQGLM